MRKRILCLLCALALCLGLTPATALAADNDKPNNLYVGNQNVKSGEDTTYWATTDSGELELVEGASDTSNNWNVKYEPNSATLTLKNATIEGAYDDVNTSGAGIYAASSSGPVSLNIVLEEENKVSGWNGINVSGGGGDASLNISGSGSLTVSGLSGNGIGIFMSSQNSANLTIEEANVTASGSQIGGSGVRLITSQTGSPSLAIEVKGGSLQASGATNGIHFLSNVNDATAAANLQVIGNAMVKASNITTTKDGTGSAPELTIGASTGDTGGIVWNGSNGTVYGDVTLGESLTIGEGETLTIPQGSTLNTNGNLTNNGTIVNTGGALTGEPGGIIVTAPAITTESLSEGMVGQTYTAPLEATGNDITWSAIGLPAGLTLDADTGAITGTPTADGRFPVTVTATNSVDSASKEYTLNIKPATVSVTGLKLDKDSLTLQEKGSRTLTATVEPADATNKDVTWASSDNNIATVDDDGTVTAVSAGRATITATAADGSGASASCEVTVTHGDMVQTPKKDATCTADGTEGYWTCGICGKHFKDEGGTVPTTPEENVIPKTGHAWGDDGHCTVCGAVESDFVPEIIAGANATWHKGSGKDLSFTSNAAYGDFLKVLVDGEELDDSNYAVEPGSTAVALKASYLETLSVGKHTLGIVSDTGTAETEFTVAADGQAVDDEAANDGGRESLAKTGDGFMLPIAALSVIAAVAAVAGAFSLRRIRL